MNHTPFKTELSSPPPPQPGPQLSLDIEIEHQGQIHVVFSERSSSSGPCAQGIIHLFAHHVVILAIANKLKGHFSADQKERVLSDSHPCLQSSKAEPLIRNRPLSDIYPFQNHAERGSVPYLLSGCGADVEPMIPGPRSDESRVNGVKSSAWSSSVSGLHDRKPYSSKIMRLFSNSRKGPGSLHTPAPDSPNAAHSSSSSSQPWTGLSGFGVVDSFKKLRSSVLQGIQTKGAAIHNGDHDHDMTNGSDLNHTNCGLADAANDLNTSEGCSVATADVPSQMFAAIHQYSSDVEDCDEEEYEFDEFSRNQRFSRSIRRAYGAGRISLSDKVNVRQAGGCNREAGVTPREPNATSKANTRTENVDENTNVKVLNRLSKSAENIHLFKAPFRRKAPSSSPPQEDLQRNGLSNGTPNILRTSSASSVDLRSSVRNHKSGLWKTKGSMLKLVGSMTDLTARRRGSSSPGPPSPPPLSPLSRLHDNYSRRVPCLKTNERQRRPVAVDVSSVQHTPLVHHRPDCDGGSEEDCNIDSVFLEPSETIEQISADESAQHERLAFESVSTSKEKVQSPSSPQNQRNPSQHQEENNSNLLPNQVESHHEGSEALLREDVSPAASSTALVSPTRLSESPVSPTSSEDAASPSAETPSVKPRRRSVRPRPRPLSDYVQLVSRKHPIPEEAAELNHEERTADTLSQKSCSDFENESSPKSYSMSGGAQIQRRMSVAGAVDLFPADAQLKEEHLHPPLSRPPIPSHQVPPYKGVSARFRPSVLSQSTPIGLDRVGRRKLHRVLSDGSSECSATLDDSVSEEDEGSFDELTDVPPYLGPGVELSALNEWINSGHTVYAEALWDHVTMEEQELAFKAGDVIRVLDASHKDWWWGRGADREAWFPSSFVRVRVNQEDSGAESVESVADQQDPPNRDTHNNQHRKQMRSNVVQEIMNTERIYIKHLKDICEGYIRQCRKHPDMFTEQQLKIIFSNIGDIYLFQRQFLRDLEKKYNKEQPDLSEIGSCFLLQGEGFSIYSDYCNTHPAACAELQRLMKLGKYKHFFEACRLLQQMIDISIAGFLLTPVQKICKYPLQLGELLKYTPKNHSDYCGVSKAYEAMKNVASLINERKRRLESIDTIAHWQVSILHWEGPDVLERSSELIHSGELTRAVRQSKMQQRSFFLFDHQLVFCKKDVLRRDLLHYRGRLDMDKTEVLDVPDGRDPDLGLNLRNALRLRHAFTLEFMCVLCCRKAQDKQRWLQAFSKERQRVKDDQEMGIEISEEQRKQAIINARRAKHGKMKNIGYSGSAAPHHQNLPPLQQRHITIPTSVPEQQVFTLAEPPKQKPHHLLYTFTRNAFFRK
uniref:Spermatogenesis-associated protein 13 n=1 Tax=Oryzias latipes TaxID=8090 RepID=A0A3P9I115_ORYLA